MQKRGQAEVLETLTLFELLAGFAVATILILAALGYNNFTAFSKTYLEKDLAMVHDAVSASPAVIKVEYPVSSSFRVEVTDEKINIASSDSLGLGSYSNHTVQSDGIAKRGMQ